MRVRAAARASRAPREALALWRGRARSPTSPTSRSPPPEIRRLDELRLRAAELAIDADLAAGRHAEVIGELDALVAAHPLRERLHAQRMLALYRAGRQSEALDAYRAARAALVEQIGVEPGAELQRAARRRSSRTTRRSTSPAAAEPQPVDRRAAAAPAALPSALVAAAALVLAGVTRVRRDPRRSSPTASPGIDENAVGLIDPDGGRITAQYRRRPQPRRGRPPAAARSGSPTRLDGTVSRIDRERDQVVTIDGRRRAGGARVRRRARCGWPTATGASVAQVDPGAEQGRAADRGRQRAARAGAVAAGALWVASGVDGAVHRIDLGRAHASAPDPARREPDRDRRRRRRALGGERGGRHRDAHRAADRAASSRAIPVGNGPSALAVGEGAVWVVNRPDGTLSRIDPRRTRCRGRSAVGRDPTAVAVGDGAVWVAGGEERHRRPRRSRTARAWSSGSGPAAARRRSRSRAGRCGRPRSPRGRRIAAARCACTRADPGAASRSTGCTRTATARHVDAG